MSRPISPRMRKVNELMREVVADAVRELKDPRLGFITVTGVETAPNLRSAIVFYSVLGTAEEQAATRAALASAARRIQAVVATEVRLKYTPVLTFTVDESIERGARIDRIIEEIRLADSIEGGATVSEGGE